MASRALLRGWRIEILARFYNLIVATGAIAMKGLLINQRYQFRADLEFDLRNLRQQLGFHLRPSMTITTGRYPSRARVFLK